MATAYGGYYTGAGYNAFRARMDYSTTSSNDTSATIQVQAKCQMGSGHDSGGNFRGTANINGNTSTYTGSGYYNAESTYTMGTKTLSVNKTHSAQNVAVKVTVTSTYAWSGHSSTASATISVPAKTHYTVSYNANSGSGAPSSQTKWYGEQLTLSTTKPTRSGYTFLGWATSSSATSATYAAGATYKTNSALSLYAVWKKNYVAPTISSGTAYRCDSSGTAEDEGTYVAGKVTWSVDTAQTSGNKGKNLVIAYYNPSTSAYVNLQTITLSTASGTTNYGPIQPSGGFSTDQSYKIRFTVTDTTTNSGNSATKVVTLSQAFFLMDALAQTSGKALVFGRAATSADNGKVVVGGALQLQLKGANPVLQVIHPDTSVGVNFGIGGDGYNRGIYDPTGKRWAFWIDSSNNVNIHGITEDSWHTTTYASPFSNYNGSAGNAPHYRKYGDVVSFYGIATVTSEQSNAVRTLFTLPTGYRPSGYTRYLGRMQGSGANSWELSVNTSGQVQLQRYGTTSSIAVPENAWLTFSGTFII